MEVKEEDVVFCQVKKIEGTTIFLDVEDGMQGSMVLSEVAPGRIRNLRDYVEPGKKVVCKVLKISGNNLELSLRRVTAKERQQVLDRYKKERALANILKLVDEDAEKIITQIKKEYDIPDFFDEIRLSSKILEKYVKKGNVEKIIQAISEKVEREKKVLTKIILKSFGEEGVNEIKEILDLKNVEMHYLGSSIFSISVTGRDFKEANNKLNLVLQEIEKRAKEKKVVFEIVKGK